MSKLKVVELFAGVGGFRIGLEATKKFKVVWSNQWEPSTKTQHASAVYENRFGKKNHSSEDIHEVPTSEIPDCDVLVGGFPCQDYSVATTLKSSKGLQGKKGVLWWQINRIIEEKKVKPKYLILENVDRLLKSPTSQRGRDFAIMLATFDELGYSVEWRVINAADYGMPQKRKRIFILAYRNSNYGTPDINGKPNFGCKRAGSRGPMQKWLIGKNPKGNPNWECSPFSDSDAFPCSGEIPQEAQFLPHDLESFTSKSTPFGNAGYAWKKKGHKMPDGSILTDVNMFWTTDVRPDYDGDKMSLDKTLDDELDPEYEVDASRIDEWLYAKGSKNEFRLRKRDRENVESELVELYEECMGAPFGERASKWKEHRHRFLEEVGEDKFYQYDEGAMRFDSPDRPSRTVVTDEIGRTPSRMRHIIEYEEGRYRRLSPEETERLNGFRAGWTDIEGIRPSRRGFLMGNALVVGIIERLRGPLRSLINSRGLE